MEFKRHIDLTCGQDRTRKIRFTLQSETTKNLDTYRKERFSRHWPHITKDSDLSQIGNK